MPDTNENRLLYALQMAKRLAAYTIKICMNEKNFDPKFYPALTVDIIQTAKDIYLFGMEANNIRVLTKSDWKQRSYLQKKSMRLCKRLIYSIELGRRVYHISGRRVHYWEAMAIDTRNLLQAWHEADSKRYGT